MIEVSHAVYTTHMQSGMWRQATTIFQRMIDANGALLVGASSPGSWLLSMHLFCSSPRLRWRPLSCSQSSLPGLLRYRQQVTGVRSLPHLSGSLTCRILPCCGLLELYLNVFVFWFEVAMSCERIRPVFRLSAVWTLASSTPVLRVTFSSLC